MWGVEVLAATGDVVQTVITGQATGAAFTSSPMSTVNLESLNLDTRSGALIRICGYGATNAGADWRVDNVRIFTGGCTDGIENGFETDPDCGGPDCAPCS